MRRLSALGMVAALVISACQVEVVSSTTTGLSLPTTTTTQTTTTDRPMPTTSSPPTSVVPTTTTSEPAAYGPDWYWPTRQPGAGEAEGSGCAPGSEVLPDGYWFGIAIEHRTDEIVFDLACWYDDPDAENGYRIGNDNPNLRTVEVAAGAMVWRVDLDSEGGFAPPVPYPEWVGNYSVIVSCPGDFCLVWLRTEDGFIQEMVEQYVP